MRPRRFRSRLALTTVPLALAALAVGCEEPKNLPGQKPVVKAPPKDNFIVGKRTQEIGRADDPALKKGANLASDRVTAKDPITVTGNAYVVSIDRVAKLNIQHTLDLYHATNDRWPASHDEFMNDVIRANNIALPQLPHYQKYVYDVDKHALLVYEYPALKAGPPPQ